MNGILCDEIPRQWQNTDSAFTERGHANRHDHEPIVEVLAKRSFLDAGGQVAVGSRKNPHLDLNGLVAPLGRTLLSCSRRSSLACTSEVSPPISSRNNVPPSAARTRPGLLSIAPVKVPFTWPNSSLSINVPTSVAESTGGNTLSSRGEVWCSARATNSLPTPLSPMVNTGVASLRRCEVS